MACLKFKGFPIQPSIGSHLLVEGVPPASLPDGGLYLGQSPMRAAIKKSPNCNSGLRVQTLLFGPTTVILPPAPRELPPGIGPLHSYAP